MRVTGFPSADFLRTQMDSNLTSCDTFTSLKVGTSTSPSPDPHDPTAPPRPGGGRQRSYCVVKLAPAPVIFLHGHSTLFQKWLFSSSAQHAGKAQQGLCWTFSKTEASYSIPILLHGSAFSFMSLMGTTSTSIRLYFFFLYWVEADSKGTS